MADKTTKFSGCIKRTVYDSDNFAVYAVDVPADVISAKQLKKSKYGDITVCGNISGLEEGVMYDFDAVMQTTRHGYSYEAKKVVGSEHFDSTQNIVMFLTTILTDNQAFELLKNYPNIVELVIHGQSDQVDLTKLNGIKEATFEVIKRKILENHDNMELLSFFGGAVSLKTISKIRNKYPSIDSVKKLFKKDPYSFLMEFQGTAFVTADNILLKMQNEQNLFDYDLETSAQRCLAFMKYKLNEIAEEEGSTLYDLVKLKEDVSSVVPKCANHFAECLKDNDIIWHDASSVGVALSYMRNMEEECAESILDGLDHPIIWNIDVEKYRNTEEHVLTDEQIQALKRLCKYNICILNGFGGAGKSYTTKSIVDMLEENQKRYLLMSPTAKAARVLKSYTNRPASTIHRGYGYTPSEGWKINSTNKLDIDALIIDEASMLSVSLFYHVLQGLDLRKTKLLLVGDSAQLSSIGAGSVLHDMINSGVVPTTSLTKIFRYDEGGISKIATDIRQCRQFLPGNAREHKTLLFGKNRDYSFTTSDNDHIVSDVVSIYSKLIEGGKSISDIQIITAYNVGKTGAQMINNAVQKAINKKYGTDNYIKFGQTLFYEDDIVVQKKNNYRAQEFDLKEWKVTGEENLVCNGDVGKIIKIEKFSAIIQFDDKCYFYTKQEFSDVRLGYAISVHSSQGSQSDIVIFSCPTNQAFMMSSNLLYVGCTRSKKRCIHIGDPDMLKRAVKKKDEKYRKTFLCSFLKRDIQNSIDENYVVAV